MDRTSSAVAHSCNFCQRLVLDLRAPENTKNEKLSDWFDHVGLGPPEFGYFEVRNLGEGTIPNSGSQFLVFGCSWRQIRQAAGAGCLLAKSLRRRGSYVSQHVPDNSLLVANVLPDYVYFTGTASSSYIHFPNQYSEKFPSVRNEISSSDKSRAFHLCAHKGVLAQLILSTSSFNVVQTVKRPVKSIQGHWISTRPPIGTMK